MHIRIPCGASLLLGPSVLQPASEATPRESSTARRMTQTTLRHEGLVLVPEGHRAPARRRLAPIQALGVALVVRRHDGVEGRLARREE